MTTLKKYITSDKTVRLASIITTPLAQNLVSNQEISALCMVVAGRLLTGAALMAAFLKERQKIGLFMRGDGPIKSVFAEANYEGSCRAYCEQPRAEFVENAPIGAGIGNGILEVVRQVPFQKEPHVGQVEIQTGEVGDDLAYYLKQSQQIPAVVAVGCIPNSTGCEAAGGYILEVMPDCSEETLEKIERVQKQVPSVTKLIGAGAEAQDLVSDYLINFSFEELTHPHEFQYNCRCSVGIMERSLTTLGSSELKKLVKKNEILEVVCEFCGKAYQVNPVQMQRLINQLPK